VITHSTPETTETPLIPDQRREAILRQLRSHKVLSIQQLMATFSCSHMTIRRDIAALEQAGLVFNVQGGVRIAHPLGSEASHFSKASVDQPEKRAIASVAAQNIRPDTTIYLDAGTTMLAIVPHIVALNGMTVITNDFEIVRELASATHVSVIHTGGQLDHPNLSGVGPLAAATLRHLSVDVAFISSSSWDVRRGVTTPSSPKVEVKLAAMSAASQRVLAVASSKYGLFGLYKVAGLEQFDLVITDDGLAPDAALGMRESGIDLILAPVVD
jgi:DeoR/GlpR family transcriptional regulator of sugar metabolism